MTDCNDNRAAEGRFYRSEGGWTTVPQPTVNGAKSQRVLVTGTGLKTWLTDFSRSGNN